jgi:hypothetical protein
MWKQKKERKHLGRSGAAALCNLASLKNLVMGEKKIFLQKKNTIRKYTTEHTKEMRLNASTYTPPFLLIFRIVANLHFPSTHIFCHQLGSLCITCCLTYSFHSKLFALHLLPPFTIFYIANPMLRGGWGFQFSYFLIISRGANIHFRIAAHIINSPPLFALLVCFRFLFFNTMTCCRIWDPTFIRTWTCTQLDGHALPPFFTCFFLIFLFHSDECLDKEKE